METSCERLDVFDCVCHQCAHRFEELKLPELTYGYKLMRSPDTREIVLAPLLGDAVADEVGQIVDDLLRGTATEDDGAEAFDRAFGVSCDPIGGRRFDMGQRITCPVCGSDDVNLWDTTPPRSVERELPVVSHSEWQTWSREQKIEAVRRALGLDKSRETGCDTI